MAEIAPDGSTITPLLRTDGASQVLCTLEPHQTTTTVRHKQVEEFWYVLEGDGEICFDGREIASLSARSSHHIPANKSFQFRSLGTPLKVLITTIPAWPGDQEAELLPHIGWPE